MTNKPIKVNSDVEAFEVLMDIMDNPVINTNHLFDYYKINRNRKEVKLTIQTNNRKYIGESRRYIPLPRIPGTRCLRYYNRNYFEIRPRVYLKEVTTKTLKDSLNIHLENMFNIINQVPDYDALFDSHKTDNSFKEFVGSVEDYKEFVGQMK